MAGLFTIAVGMMGCGKTSAIVERLGNAPRVLAFDPMSEFGPEDGFEIIDGFETSMNAIWDLCDQQPEGPFRQSHRFQNVHADAWLRNVWSFAEVTEEPITLVLDEADQISEQADLHSRDGRASGLAYLANIGRRLCDNVYLSARRFAQINPTLRESARLNLIFYTDEEASLRVIQARWGKEAREAVTNLGDYEYIELGPEAGRTDEGAMEDPADEAESESVEACETETVEPTPEGADDHEDGLGED